jgi:hypothetical protein
MPLVKLFNPTDFFGGPAAALGPIGYWIACLVIDITYEEAHKKSYVDTFSKIDI